VALDLLYLAPKISVHITVIKKEIENQDSTARLVIAHLE